MSEHQYDYPFDIMDVAGLLDIRIRRKGGRSVYADCPFCGDKRGKMNFNLAKNVFRCNSCGHTCMSMHQIRLFFLKYAF